ncbi:DUF1178 family protein [Lacibacterium aquatile]|uniref:DUF1178 family protein n=1 Tax=Lacibacterium aquatile TaxID=1168082 RepID=A0ABW5DYJ9_9PROT
MIVYSLQCTGGHQFDGWFRDSATYDAQTAAHEVSCPVCGSLDVSKALMAPAVRSSKKREATQATEAEQAQAAVMQALKTIRREVEDNCDYVGSQFAEEARRIHYGEADKRGIYGEASADQAAELADEGIEVGQIPWVQLDN